ncbi:MAG: hypothetical protein WCY05_04045 [Candidatus Omnitrophota bacterium]
MRFLILISFFLFTSAGIVFAGEKVQMSPDQGPQILQAVGEGDAELAPSRYPEFVNYESDNPTCGEYLKKQFNENAVTNDVSQDGMSLAPLWVKSKYRGDVKTKGEVKKASYALIPGLSYRYNVPPAYRKTANLLVTWTVRIEGYKTEPYIIWPSLCDMWHGTSQQRFPGGEVKTALFINGGQKGQESVMTIPDGGVTTSYQPSDPTHTGSFLLTSASFSDGKFPETINIEVKWYNDTCMKLLSPKKMRNLVITVVPVERTAE